MKQFKRKYFLYRNLQVAAIISAILLAGALIFFILEHNFCFALLSLLFLGCVGLFGYINSIYFNFIEETMYSVNRPYFKHLIMKMKFQSFVNIYEISSKNWFSKKKNCFYEHFDTEKKETTRLHIYFDFFDYFRYLNYLNQKEKAKETEKCLEIVTIIKKEIEEEKKNIEKELDASIEHAYNEIQYKPFLVNLKLNNEEEDK